MNTILELQKYNAQRTLEEWNKTTQNLNKILWINKTESTIQEFKDFTKIIIWEALTSFSDDAARGKDTPTILDQNNRFKYNLTTRYFIPKKLVAGPIEVAMGK